MLALNPVLFFHDEYFAADLQQLVPTNRRRNLGQDVVSLQECSLVPSSMQLPKRWMDVVVRVALSWLPLVNLIQDALRENRKHNARGLRHSGCVSVLVREHRTGVERQKG